MSTYGITVPLQDEILFVNPRLENNSAVHMWLVTNLSVLRVYVLWWYISVLRCRENVCLGGGLYPCGNVGKMCVLVLCYVRVAVSVKCVYWWWVMPALRCRENVFLVWWNILG